MIITFTSVTTQYQKIGSQYSINLETGSLDWRVPAGDDQGIPTVSQKYVFRNNFPEMEVINRQTGEKFTIHISDNPKFTESTQSGMKKIKPYMLSPEHSILI